MKLIDEQTLKALDGCPIDQLTEESREKSSWDWDNKPTLTHVTDYKHPVRNQPNWNIKEIR